MVRFLAKVAALGVVLTAQLASAQIQFDDVKIATTKLTDQIFMLEGSGGNIGVLVGDDGLLVVDDQYAPLAERIKSALKALSDEPVRYMLNTHWHFDHTGGNEAFGESGAVIVAHDNVRKRMGRDEFMKLLKQDIPASPEIALPAITFSRNMTFHFGGQTVAVYHAPRAHTDGDAFVHFADANVIHAGDVFWNGTYPFIDTGSGGGLEGTIDATKRMLALANDDTKIIPGHGPLGSKQDLQVYLEMLETTHERLTKYLDQQMSLNQVVFKRPLKDLDEKWGKGFIDPERFVRILYTDMARN